jgi:hypothetical protein
MYVCVWQTVAAIQVKLQAAIDRADFQLCVQLQAQLKAAEVRLPLQITL